MLEAASPSNYGLRTQVSTAEQTTMADSVARNNDDAGGSDDDFDESGGNNKGSSRNKSRRELPSGAVATLKAWLLSPEHFTHPYPTPQDQVMLMQKTGIDKKQLKNWFTNARRRIWKPMLKKQLEQGKLTATGAGGGGVAVPGIVPAMMVPSVPGVVPGQPEQDGTQNNMHVQYQQTVQHMQQPQMGQPAQPQQEVAVDAYGQPLYAQHTTPGQPLVHPGAAGPPTSQYYDANNSNAAAQSVPMPQNHSIGSLPPLTPNSSGQQLSKTDSHAVLMELFARDQDLVRQASESASLKAAGGKAPGQSQGFQSQSQQQGQHQEQLFGQSLPPNQSKLGTTQSSLRVPSQGRLVNVPTLNSWPHFSSISSLNNLGTMPGVKSITSLSGADLANQGPVNKVGNLAQVKSVESMGKNDSYAFLEVFFGDKSSNALSSAPGAKDQRGMKRDRDEDNDVGLSLEDESPSSSTAIVKQEPSSMADAPSPAPSSGMSPTPFAPNSKGNDGSGTLKRAYDDALAARGLISVSRSCEKLTDLALPAKMQRTLSREYLRQQQVSQNQQQQQQQQQYGQFQYTQTQAKAPSPATASNDLSKTSQNVSQQYPGQNPGQAPAPASQIMSQNQGDTKRRGSYLSNQSDSNASVEVPSATKCAICHQTNVDTQLRPCGHMFHERCLKPSFQSHMGPPKCPIDHIAMQSALLAVPTDEPQPNQWGASVSPSPNISKSSKGQHVASESQRTEV